MLHRRSRVVITLGLLASLVIPFGHAPAHAYPEAPWFRPAHTYSGNFPDPTILFENGIYYAYATATGGSFLPVMTSTDLVTWTPRPAYSPNPYNADPFFNDALPAIPSYVTVDWFDAARNRNASEIQAPGVAKIGSKYVAYLTLRCPVPGGWRRCIGTATANSPLGPFVPNNTGPLVRDDAAGGVIDADPFIDPVSGIPYLLWKTEGIPGTPTRIWVRRLAANGESFAPGSSAVQLLQTAPWSWQGSLIENPAMIRYNGRYYLFYSGNFWYSANYAIGYAICSGPTGPCTDRTVSTPLLGSRADRIGPGAAKPFVDAANNLRIAYHAWPAPYVNYPTFDKNFNVVACGEPTVPQPFTVPVSCPFQGQRFLFVDQLTVNADGTLNRPPLDMGAPQPAVTNRRFKAITPYRILDSRNLSQGMTHFHAVKPDGRWVIPLPVMGRGRGPWNGPDRIPATGVSAVVMNVTVTEGESVGYISAYPCGAPIPFPERPSAISNLNYAANQVRPNLVVSQVGANGRVCLFTEKRAHLIVDVVGYFDSNGSNALFNALSPTRILDSRSGPNNLAWSSPLPAGTPRNLKVTDVAGVPPDATAVVLNVTALFATATTDIRVWPAGQPMPDASNLNLGVGQITPNLVVVGVGSGGNISVRSSSGNVHVLADVVGYFASSGSVFSSLSPARILSTRDGIGGPVQKIGPGGTRVVQVRNAGVVPAEATAAVVNVTAFGATELTHLTAYPSNVAPPLASNLNVFPGDVVANLVMVPIAPDGTITLRNNSGTVHAIVDVFGYYT